MANRSTVQIVARRLSGRRATTGLLVLPALALMVGVIAIPFVMIGWTSITVPTLGIRNYTLLFTDSITLTIVSRTIVTALIVTLIALVLGYPYAYLMTRVGTTMRLLLIAAVLVPFWTSMTARNFAWLLLEQRNGPIENTLAAVGINDVALLGTTAGVVVAMVQVMLPFMVLPLYSNMAGIDQRLLLAAQSLGSSPTRAFRRIFLPLSKSGIASGMVLVFALSFGFYVTPAILGSPQQSLVAQLLAQRTLQLLDFAGAGALGIAVLLFTLILVSITTRLGGSVSAVGAPTTVKGARQ